MALIKNKKGRLLIIILCAILGLGSGWLPDDYLKINISLLVIGFIISIIAGVKSLNSNKIPNIFGGVLATPSNLKKLNDSKMRNNESFALFVGLSLSVSSAISLGLRIELGI